ncbi:MAG: nucleotide exchange factor GrpE [Marinilabiliales bacterium]|nr:MAG: nucleotide exchange factor GrpE [Marinilabiliales bacterium]
MKDNKEVSTEAEAKETKEVEKTEEKSKKTKKASTAKKTKATKYKSAEKKLRDEIEILNQANGELKDKYLRLVAEYDNFRKRTAKEKIELREVTKSSLLVDFLSIVDDVDRAMLHIDEVKDVEATIEGVKLINNKFKDFLKIQGIEEIDAKDKEFDTDMHEAVTKFPVEDEDKKGKVIDVVQKGYKLNDKVVRFSKVVVGE